MARTAILWPAGMRTAARTFSFCTRVPAGSSVRAMTTSSSACNRMVRSAACSIGASGNEISVCRRNRATFWRRGSSWIDRYLLVVARDERAAFADQKVEIGAVACLQHLVDVKLPVAALERRLRRLPARTARGELALAHQELKLALRHVELDLVAVAHERERAAGGRLGRDVQHYRAVRGAAHARIGDAHHVGDAA